MRCYLGLAVQRGRGHHRATPGLPGQHLGDIQTPYERAWVGHMLGGP